MRGVALTLRALAAVRTSSTGTPPVTTTGAILMRLFRFECQQKEARSCARLPRARGLCVLDDDEMKDSSVIGSQTFRITLF